jgi:hypothetical protein
MKGFMPGIQARGTHAFDPASSTSRSATDIINAVNAEEDGEEDQVDPLDSIMDNTLASQATTLSSLVDPDLGAGSSSGQTSSILLPFSPDHLAGRTSSGSTSGTGPPPSSSLPPPSSSHPPRATPDASMGSAHSIATGSDTGQKRKRDTKSMGSRPPSVGGSKRSSRSSRSKTKDLNPIIISSALNSTLNRMADVMERSLNATAATVPDPVPLTTAPATIPSVALPATTTPSVDSQPSDTSQPSGSPMKTLERVIDIISRDDSLLSDDELLAASLFFTKASEDAIRAAHTFLALGNNRPVQHLFLIRQLEIAALLPGKGKGKATEDDDHSMVY